MIVVCRLICVAVLVGVIHQPATAQDGTPTNSAKTSDVDVLETLSLESIRANLPSAANSAEMGMGGEAMMGEGMEPSGRQILLKQINQIRQLLSAPDQDRKDLEPLLREILAEYFVADMEERVREFDKIKARFAQMEAKLQTRLDRRYEVVELQIKQMLHKADGLDFFVPDGAGGSMPEGMPGRMMGMMGAGAPGSTGGTADGDYGMMASGVGLGVMGSEESSIPGYDIGFRTTRFLRFQNKALKPADPLKMYESLDASSDRANRLAKLQLNSSDNEKLKALLLAMHNFHSIFAHWPSERCRRYRTEEPHSWRVALLPILGHAELYKQYRFDEPWDSESNVKLLEKMPAIFGSKDDQDLKSGKTRFQMLVGNGAAFESSRPTEMRHITDGTSNTIALVKADSSVPWTKPEDLQFVPNATLSKLAASRLVGMCDGSIRNLLSVREPEFTILATKAGGEVTPQY